MFDVVEKISGRVRRTATAEAKKLGVPQDVAEQVVLAAVAYSVANAEQTGEELRTGFTKELNSSGEDFAVAYRKAVADKTLRPSYDKAVKAGVDPVPFLQADLGLTKDEAEVAVAELKRQDEEVAQTLADDEDEPVTSPGPAPDLYQGAVPAGNERY